MRNQNPNIHTVPVRMPDGKTIMPELLTTEEAIIFLRLENEKNPERTLKHYRDKGQLRGVKIGVNFLYPKQELLDFIQTATDWFNRNKKSENIS